jgi:hypothetical protein
MTEVDKHKIDANWPEDFQAEANPAGGFRSGSGRHRRGHELASRIGTAISHGTSMAVALAFTGPASILETLNPLEEEKPGSIQPETDPNQETQLG